MKKLFYFWNELKNTFWFIPSFLITVAIFLSLGFLFLDSQVTIKPEGITAFLFTGSAKAAYDILSTISGAMIGVAGTVFSITLVALTLASSQFGPRLIRNFMYDRINQVVLGSYAATYVYCLIILNSIKDNDQIQFIPSFSILFALLATVVNIILLVIFFHHITTNIQADNIIAEISNSLSKTLSDFFPDQIEEGAVGNSEEEANKETSKCVHHQSLVAAAHGYMRYVDIDSLIKLGVKHEVIVELFYRPGDYLVENQEIGRVHGQESLKDEVLSEFRSQFIFGKSRTKEQDLEHSIHQLVEIASRALSPGINDPFTAISCINNLTSVMCYLAKAQFPSSNRYDESGELRLVTKVLTFDGMLGAAFNQIRQYSRGNPSVVIRLMEALETINDFARKSGFHEKAIKKHAQMVLNMAEKSFEEKNDLEDLRSRSQKILSE